MKKEVTNPIVPKALKVKLFEAVNRVLKTNKSEATKKIEAYIKKSTSKIAKKTNKQTKKINKQKIKI